MEDWYRLFQSRHLVEPKTFKGPIYYEEKKSNGIIKEDKQKVSIHVAKFRCRLYQSTHLNIHAYENPEMSNPDVIGNT